jgi:hypothetical protein
MGYNRSGDTRKKRLRRAKKHMAQLERKAAKAAEGQGTPAEAGKK